MTEPIDLEAIKLWHANDDRRYPDITGWASPDAHLHRGQLIAEVERLREDNRRLMAKSGEPEGYWAIWRIAGELSAENERLRARVAELERWNRPYGANMANLDDAIDAAMSEGER